MIIGLTGHKGCGKTTIANYLVESHNFREVTFATKLKKVCQILYDFSDQQLTDPVLKETVDQRHGFSPRQAFQEIGDLFRAKKSSFWIDYAGFDQMTEERLVISDIRFPNEAEYLRRLGQKTGQPVRLIKITRDGLLADGHISETAMETFTDYDAVVENNGTVAEVRAIVAGLIA